MYFKTNEIPLLKTLGSKNKEEKIPDETSDIWSFLRVCVFLSSIFYHDILLIVYL